MSHPTASNSASRLRALALIGTAAVTILLLEVGTCALVRAGQLEIPAPREEGPDYWWGNHPSFGVWRRANAGYLHQTACFRVEYQSNSYGARDQERPRRATEKRLIVLGDSFLAGWGLPNEQRLSDRLEAKTGLPHLNFAMAHFGTYQELLVYRDLASGFDHSGVLVGILPANDFSDIDFEIARDMSHHEHRYRPYLVGEAPDWEHLDYRENGLRRWLRHRSYAFNALLSVLDLESSAAAAARRATPNEGPPHSKFYDFQERSLAIMEESLSRLHEAAEGRPIALVLLPTRRDLERYRESGPDPLSQRLKKFAQPLGIRVVNLLPTMASHTQGWGHYFHTCDYHWSAFANSVALESLTKELKEIFYDGS